MDGYATCSRNKDSGRQYANQSREPICLENHVVSAPKTTGRELQYYMTRMFYKYAQLPTLTSLFPHFHLQGHHTLSSVTFRENTLTLSTSTNRVNTHFLLFTFDFHNQPP